jgi:serine/threonine-protein kinase
LNEPTRILNGTYELLGKVRAGGMGAVWKARHVKLGTICVVKLLHESLIDDPSAQERFKREAQTALKVSHPNVVRFFDYAMEKDGTAVLVMEYIPGVDVSELMKSTGRPPLPVALEIARQTLAALGALHAMGIVHRDVSPDNLMLTIDKDGALLVKLVDLGLAKETDQKSLTETGMFMGKLKYGSPEQLGPGRKAGIDLRSDLYGLSVVLYQILTGAPPFEADTPGGWVYAHMTEAPRPFAETDAQGRIPGDVRAAVMRGLEKDRTRRFQTAAQYAKALEPARSRLGDAGLAETLDTIRTLREARRARSLEAGRFSSQGTRDSASAAANEGPGSAGHLRWGVAVGAAVIAVIALASVLFWSRRVDPPAPRPAPSVSAATTGAPGGPGTPGVLSSAVTPVPGVAKGGISFVALPNADIRVFASGTSQEVPLPGHTTPLFVALAPGVYRVELTFPGTRPASREVTVEPGRSIAVRVEDPKFDVEKLVASYVP